MIIVISGTVHLHHMYLFIPARDLMRSAGMHKKIFETL